MHVFDVNRKRRIPDVICNCADLTAPDGHLYTQDANDDDYDIIIPDESNYEYIYRDDLGTFYLVKCEDALLPGIKYSREKITSKKENGVIKGELAVKDGSCKTEDTDKNELNSDVPLGEITQ